jgi:hypothetical protein
MCNFFEHAVSQGGLITAPEPHTTFAPRRTSDAKSKRPSAINKFFSHAFSSGGLLGASEPYIAIKPRHHQHPEQLDKFEEAHEVSFNDEYLRGR